MCPWCGHENDPGVGEYKCTCDECGKPYNCEWDRKVIYTFTTEKRDLEAEKKKQEEKDRLYKEQVKRSETFTPGMRVRILNSISGEVEGVVANEEKRVGPVVRVDIRLKEDYPIFRRSFHVDRLEPIE